MDAVWLLLLLSLALAEAQPNGLITDLKDGEVCLNSLQCASKCCRRRSGLSLPRCSAKAGENQACSLANLISIYFICPCESGLTCDGAMTNADFGICRKT